MDDCLLNPRPAEPRHINLVNEVTTLVGMPPIPVVASDTNNACATKTHQGRKIIAYNPQFLCGIECINYIAMESVLIHEVGHHHYNHTSSPPKTSQESHDRELHADNFAGFVQRYRNVSLKDSLSLYNHKAFANESPSHPGKERRKQAMRSGWINADKQINPEKYIVRVNPFEEFMKGVAIAASVALVFSLIGALAKGK